MRLILQLSLPFPQKRVVILIQLISKLKLIIFFLFLLIQGAILLLAVARNHPKVILKVSIAAHTTSLMASKVKQGTLLRSLQKAMAIWKMIIHHFKTVLVYQGSELSC